MYKNSLTSREAAMKFQNLEEQSFQTGTTNKDSESEGSETSQEATILKARRQRNNVPKIYHDKIIIMLDFYFQPTPQTQDKIMIF